MYYIIAVIWSCSSWGASLSIGETDAGEWRLTTALSACKNVLEMDSRWREVLLASMVRQRARWVTCITFNVTEYRHGWPQQKGSRRYSTFAKYGISRSPIVTPPEPTHQRSALSNRSTSSLRDHLTTRFAQLHSNNTG